MTVKQQLPIQQAYAVKNKWYADIPLSTVSRSFDDICLPLRGFRIPPMDFGKSGAKYRGITVNLPVGVFNQETNKVVQFKYLVNFDYSQYFAMYEWMNLNHSYDNPVPDSKVERRDEDNRWATVPVTVYLLDAFKKPIIMLKYYDCWISHFDELEFNDYDVPTVIQHGLELSYSRFEIRRNDVAPIKTVLETPVEG